MRISRGKYLVLLLVVVVAAVLGSRLVRWVEPDSVCRDCNVVVIVIDTLRADHLPTYGYERETAPFMTALADRGVVFERVFSTASKTGPATASLFTSLYPYQHGLLTGYMATMRMQNAGHGNVTLDRISRDVSTVVESFKGAGYRTFGISDNLNICEEMGFGAGFDKLTTMRYEGAPAVNKILSSWKEEILAGPRYFLYLHYMDPHQPYRRRKPWFQEGADKIASTINAYNSEISYVDRAIQEVYEEFGWDKNTIVLITSDHGEEFYEHGKIGHGKTLYREVLHVPLFIFAPGLRPRRVEQYANLIDIPPTLAGLAGLAHSPQWIGVDLLDTAREIEERSFLAQMLRRPEHRRASKQGVIDQEWQYIVRQPQDAEHPEELYNLRDDFAQAYDKSKSEPERMARMRDLLVELNSKPFGERADEVTVTMDEEMLEQLKSLGYIE